MRTFAFAAIAALATADKSDFPDDDFMHCKCHITATFNTDCNTLFSIMLPMIASWNPEPLDTPGYYTIKEEASVDYIWSQRLTYNQMYTDDQLFEFAPASNNYCTVTGRSRSETTSLLDNNVNYCNLWNVYSGAEVAAVATFNIDKSFNCSQTPDDPVTTCARY